MKSFIVSTGALLGVVILIGVKLAHGADFNGDYGDPYACFGAGRYDAMRDGRECPEPPKEEGEEFNGDYGDPYACFGAGRYDAMRDGRECPQEPGHGN